MFKMSTGVAALFLAGLIGFACSNGSGLKPGGGAGRAAKGGQAGGGVSGGSGGTIGAGGTGAGSPGGAGGIVAGSTGGTIGAGGIGEGGAGGTGGTGTCLQNLCAMPLCTGELRPNPDGCGCPICVPSPDAGAARDGNQDGPACLALPCVEPTSCPGGYEANPDPCGCPICPSKPDAGVAKDAGDADSAICPPGPRPPCPTPMCPDGYQRVPLPCACSTCVPVDGGTPVDAGKPDTSPVCGLVCPMLACAYGYVFTPGPCSCPTCAPGPDAGVAKDAGGETSLGSCAGLDECTCGINNDCAPIAEPCWCPYPQCSPSGACICGGGQFVGCAPQAIANCPGAKARVAALCPNLKGPTFDALCTRTAPECVTKCLAEMDSCSDISCTLCEACDCVGDRFSTCYGQCVTTFGH
jgi:hypothetical protein